MIDSVALNELRDMVGNKFTLIIETYLRNSNEYLSIINAAIAADDKKAMQRAAHSLRSASGQVGAIELERLLGQLEEGVENGFDPDPSFLFQLQANHAAAQIELRKILA